MKIKQIISERRVMDIVSYLIGYDWEDELAKQMDVPVVCVPKNKHVAYFFKLKLIFLKKMSLIFVMHIGAISSRVYNRGNIIPSIVDFFIRDKEKLQNFYNDFSRNPVVLISSMEVLAYLKSVGCPLNIRHWGLSIPDKYITPPYILDRKYDLLLMRRSNPVLKGFAEEYFKRHSDFCYIYCTVKKEYNDFEYYTSDNECLGSFRTREEYISLLKMVKCCMYHTPGMDGGEVRTNGFNQVTPRFLELLACGCHVIARYPDNPDTQWYHLNDFCKSVETYEEFEAQMDYARGHEIDREKYKNYLAQHCTSKRAEQLQEILATL